MSHDTALIGIIAATLAAWLGICWLVVAGVRWSR